MRPPPQPRFPQPLRDSPTEPGAPCCSCPRSRPRRRERLPGVRSWEKPPPPPGRAACLGGRARDPGRAAQLSPGARAITPRWASPTLALPRPRSPLPTHPLSRPGQIPRRLPSPGRALQGLRRDGQTDGERTRRETCSSGSPVRQLLASPCGERGGRKGGKGSRRGGGGGGGGGGGAVGETPPSPAHLFIACSSPPCRHPGPPLGASSSAPTGPETSRIFFLSSFWKLALVCVSLPPSSPLPLPPFF